MHIVWYWRTVFYYQLFCGRGLAEISICMYTDRTSIYLSRLNLILRHSLLLSISPLLAQVEWDISVLDHVSIRQLCQQIHREDILDLPAHSQSKESQEVDQEDRPVYGNIGCSGNGT
jgi:hypothetical protein